MEKRDHVIGFLEDDPDQAELILHWLGLAGYRTRMYASAAEFRRRQGSEAIDLLLLDWMLPDADGPEVVHWLRSAASARLPVSFLAARGGEADVVRGLNAGGDGYWVKPVGQQELVGRVGAVLRRLGVEGGDGGPFEIPPYRVDPRRQRISFGEHAIELTPREFDLAAFLFRRHGRIVSRDALLENVWNMNASVSTRTVDTHVSRLRKKLELNGENGWRLAAVYQHGYRLEQT